MQQCSTLALTPLHHISAAGARARVLWVRAQRQGHAGCAVHGQHQCGCTRHSSEKRLLCCHGLAIGSIVEPARGWCKMRGVHKISADGARQVGCWRGPRLCCTLSSVSSSAWCTCNRHQATAWPCTAGRSSHAPHQLVPATLHWSSCNKERLVAVNSHDHAR